MWIQIQVVILIQVGIRLTNRLQLMLIKVLKLMLNLQFKNLQLTVIKVLQLLSLIRSLQSIIFLLIVNLNFQVRKLIIMLNPILMFPIIFQISQLNMMNLLSLMSFIHFQPRIISINLTTSENLKKLLRISSSPKKTSLFTVPWMSFALLKLTETGKENWMTLISKISNSLQAQFLLVDKIKLKIQFGKSLMNLLKL